MNKILNFLSIIGLLGFCITLWWENRKNEINFHQRIIGLLLVGAIFIYARKGILSSFLKITISVFGLCYTMAKINIFSMSQFVQLAASILTLLLVLFGFYIMFGGLNTNNDEIHFSVNPRTGKIKRRWL